MRCGKSEFNADCEWCDKAWDCEIFRRYKELKRRLSKPTEPLW